MGMSSRNAPPRRPVKSDMGLAALLLLIYAVTVVLSLVVTGLAHPVRGYGVGPHPPSVREKPSADQPTPARSTTATKAEVAGAQKHIPPA